eukprot:353695-Chlamydomonas_euryale.AAC.1
MAAAAAAAAAMAAANAAAAAAAATTTTAAAAVAQVHCSLHPVRVVARNSHTSRMQLTCDTPRARGAAAVAQRQVDALEAAAFFH